MVAQSTLVCLPIKMQQQVKQPQEGTPPTKILQFFSTLQYDSAHCRDFLAKILAVDTPLPLLNTVLLSVFFTFSP